MTVAIPNPEPPPSRAQPQPNSHPDPEPSYTQFACIGTGFSGICLGATLARWYGIDSVRLFSREPDGPGGTWLVNRYPGAACDVPSALYSFSFAPNPAWSRLLPPADELRAYLCRVAAEYGLLDKMVFGVAVERCVWVEERARWRLWARELAGARRVLVHECQFLFLGVGQLNRVRELDVPGLESFRGPVFHSSGWREDVDLAGKRVVLFGNGCTAAQIVPSIVGRTKHLTQVVRSKHWIYPPVDRKVPEWGRTLLRTLPGLAALQRFVVYLAAERDWKGFAMTESAAAFRRRRRRAAEQYMRATAPEKYHRLLIPDFEVGCKRRIFDSGYLESLHAENLTLTDERAVEILPHGVRMGSGEVVEADVIVLANGFETNAYLGEVDVVGRGGETLAQHWESFGGPEAYNCCALSGFPNMFFILGPNTATGHTSTVMAIENSVNYALRVLRPVLEGRASVACVKRPAEDAYVARIQAALQRTVWMSGCSNWYIRGAGGRTWNGMSYPWSQAYFWYACLFPVWRDWEYSGEKTRPSIVKRRQGRCWFVSIFALLAGGLFAWVRKYPGSQLACLLKSQAFKLPGLASSLTDWMAQAR